MWRNDRDRPDDPRNPARETQRLSHDEYDRPRYGSPPAGYAHEPVVEHARHELAREGSVPAFEERIHELMTRRVASVHPATSVERAARLMEECDCGALPVIGDNGVLVGMVTDRDITLRVVARGRDARTAIVADCMTERVFACYAHEPVSECLRQMSMHQVRRMPIVDDRGRLVGIIAQGDLARHAARNAVREQRRALANVVSAVSEPSHAPYR
jgi:CBS domain-containing protein